MGDVRVAICRAVGRRGYLLVLPKRSEGSGWLADLLGKERGVVVSGSEVWSLSAVLSTTSSERDEQSDGNSDGGCETEERRLYYCCYGASRRLVAAKGCTG